MIRGSEQYQERVLAIVGTVVALFAAVAVLIIVTNPFGGRPPDWISVTIDTPYVGQGIGAGTAVVMHGKEIGNVTTVASLPGGGVRLLTDLQNRPGAGLTDAMNIDFRPINYFGVPGVNVIPSPGGHPLRDGAQISLVPKGNSTLSELLSQLGSVSASTLTPQLIRVFDWATRYTDGLNPLLETILIVTKAVADVQTVPTAQLLANTAAASTAIPSFADAVIDTGQRFISLNIPQLPPGTALPPGEPPFLENVRVPDLSDETEEYYQTVYHQFIDTAQVGLFAAIGKLEYSHVRNLLPMIEGVKAISDVVPPLLRPEKFAETMMELRTRFEKMYAGNSEQRALQVRIVLDSLPGVAAPLGIMGGPG
ncbi:hypothetical protein AU186_11025 [Mycobacterium sp. GA-1999]|nr:hypothetical protein AU185_11615 [Mycobacterium sp. GA-0227b]KUH85984.1 hypothetical protein AU186_11025 [Mycobacterium sp. GA-1999]KUH87776.1 hypothetical protein AU187_04330 [Mycobacterium sp. IS-1556]